jgi:hypothetical protein
MKINKEIIDGIAENFYDNLVDHVYGNIDWYMDEIDADGDEYDEVKQEIIKLALSKFNK